MLRYVPKDWGSEEWIVNNDKYCGKRLTLLQGWQSSLHMHPIKDETFYVDKGLVRLEYADAEPMLLRPGDSFHIEHGHYHRFTGMEHSIIYEFSTHHDDADVVRREPSQQVELPYEPSNPVAFRLRDTATRRAGELKTLYLEAADEIDRLEKGITPG